MNIKGVKIVTYKTKDKIREYNREYKLKNKDKIKESKREYRLKKLDEVRGVKQ